MVRVLIMIAVSGFVLSVATLTAAFAIGGPEAIARGGWHFGAHGWGHHRDDDFDWNADFDLEDGPATGPQATRTFAWDGGHSLRVRMPADIRYVQGEGPGTVTVTGPASAIERVVVDDGTVGLRRRHWANRRLTVVVTAPNVSRFVLSGANRLTLEGYKADRLELKLSGATEVTATGEVQALELDISGAGEADLSQLKVRDADIDISGTGDAQVAPTGRAKVDISGMGDVTLLTKPAQLETDISGAGTVHQAQPAPESPAPAKTTT